MTPYERVIQALDGVRASGDGAMALCPAHDDRTPSLSITEGEDGRVLLKCHAACPTEAVVARMGLSMRDLFPHEEPSLSHRVVSAVYPYHDESGELLFEVIRYDPKDFAQRRPDAGGGSAYKLGGVRRVLYRLPELVGSDPSRPVYIVEGEKDADTLTALGLIATTNAGGAGKWRAEYGEALRGREVIVVPDADAPGRQHARQVAAHLVGVAASIKIVDLPGVPDKGDVSDWFRGGRSRADLEAVAAAAACWNPEDLVEGRQGRQGGHHDDVGGLGGVSGSGGSAPVGILLSEVATERISWLWSGRIPRGKLTLLEGDPCEGKSCIALDLAARITAGQPLPFTSAGDEGPAGVVYLTAEDGLGDTLRPRLEAAGGNPERVCTFPLDDLPTLGTTQGLAQIQAAIDRVNAVLVVIDPLFAFVSSRVDTYKDQDVRRLLTPLAALAARTGVAVLAIRHLTKDTGRRPKQRGAGSIGLLAAARAALLAAPDPDDPDRRVLAPLKQNLAGRTPGLAYRIVSAEGDAARVEWLAETRHTADDLVITLAGAGLPGCREEAVVFLRTVLAAGPCLAAEVKHRAELAGISQRTLERAKSVLSVEARKQGAGAWLWSLPNRADGPDGAECAVPDRVHLEDGGGLPI